MLFNSFTFALFFLIVYLLYWANKRNYKRQNFLLFVASYIFYGWWDVRFLFLLVIVTFIDYTATLLIDQQKLTSKQKTKAYSFLAGAAILFVLVQKIESRSSGLFITGFLESKSVLSGWFEMTTEN